MATYYLYSGAGGAATGADWANAFLTLAAAIAAATTAGDVIKVHKTHTEELAVDTSFAFATAVNLICVDKDASDALAEMGTGAWIGNSTTNRAVGINSVVKPSYIRGVTFRTAGATADIISVGNTEDSHIEYENCYFWHGNVNPNSNIQLGASDAGAYAKLKNCTFRFGHTAQGIYDCGRLIIEGGSVSSAGSTPVLLFKGPIAVDEPGGTLEVDGCDLSLVTNTLVSDSTDTHWLTTFRNCKLGSGVTILQAQTNTTKVSAEVFLFNCASGDTHYQFAHYDALGQTVALTSPYVSDGALYDGTNHVSWQITTSGNCSFYTPYVSPWMEQYHSGTSSITPSIEGLRINNATVAQDDEVWGEFSYQGTSGNPLALFANDRMAVLGTPADQTSSKTYSDWTASPATDSGDSVFKLTSPSITPAEIGMLRARVCVGEPSITVYIDPTIRT